MISKLHHQTTNKHGLSLGLLRYRPTFMKLWKVPENATWDKAFTETLHSSFRQPCKKPADRPIPVRARMAGKPGIPTAAFCILITHPSTAIAHQATTEKLTMKKETSRRPHPAFAPSRIADSPASSNGTRVSGGRKIPKRTKQRGKHGRVDA